MKNKKQKTRKDITFTELQLNDLSTLLCFIATENNAQIKKWGIQTHNSAEWNLILNEEVGELTKEMLEIHFSNKETAERHYKTAFKEAIQVSTLSLKIAEILNNLIKNNNEK